jgi:hypothetical protein
VDNNLSPADMTSLAFSMSGLRTKDILVITAPTTRFGTSPQGASIDIGDEARMAQLSSSLKNDDMSKIPLGPQIP